MGADYAISRLDLESAGTHGWQVRLQRKGVRFVRFFADSTWGGKRAALHKARQYRDRLLSRIERSSGGTMRVRSSPASRNRSGVVGVSRVISVGANGIRYAFWQASWSPAGGRRRTARFSVLRLGEEEAFRLACLERRRGISGEESR